MKTVKSKISKTKSKPSPVRRKTTAKVTVKAAAKRVGTAKKAAPKRAAVRSAARPKTVSAKKPSPVEKPVAHKVVKAKTSSSKSIRMPKKIQTAEGWKRARVQALKGRK